MDESNIAFFLLPFFYCWGKVFHVSLQNERKEIEIKHFQVLY